MDEPFSALDVLTAENLRFELLDLWLEKRIPTKSILIVTHGIEEAVTLADRVIVLGRNPGRIRADLPITLPHYRDRKSPEFQALVDQVYKILTNPDLPDLSTQTPTTTTSTSEPKAQPKYQSLPHVRIGSVAGLLELLEGRQDKDLYRIAQELLLEVDDILPIVDACKLMELVAITEGDIQLSEIGENFINSNIDERKAIIRELLQKNIRLVQQICQLLQAKRNHRISEELVLDILENYFTTKEAQRQLRTAMDWGRYAELFSYDEPSGEIFIEESTPETEESE
jgi:NitT/TauT family transport system ATP-binding protein